MARKMSVVQLTMLTTVNILGSGIVLLPTKLAALSCHHSGTHPPGREDQSSQEIKQLLEAHAKKASTKLAPRSKPNT